MLITLIEKDRIYTKTLPQKVNGQFWITHVIDQIEENVIGIEGIEGNWVMKSNRNACVLDGQNAQIKSVFVKPLCFYNVKLKDLDEKVLVFAEPINESRQVFRKYIVADNTVIQIGRESNNAIQFSNKFVSSTHAILQYTNNQWIITDNNSRNGTYVNERRVTTQNLTVGDIVFIMGFKIIIGNRFIAVNNPDERMTYNQSVLFPWVKQELMQSDSDDEAQTSNGICFYRSPRFKRDIKTAKFTIDPPPQTNNGDEMPMILMLGPSITMGMASMTTGLFAVNNAIQNGNLASAVPSVVMSVSMLLGTVLWPILAKKFEKKRKIQREAKRQEKYKYYLHSMDEQMKQEGVLQAEISHENHVRLEECIDRIMNVKRNLWERSVGQDDFLKLRLGLGDLPLDAEVKYSERKFTLDDDNLQEESFGLGESLKMLHQVPVTVSIFDDYISGIIGSRAEVIAFTKGLIFEIAALHSYDEVKMIFIFSETEKEEFDFVKWLPHIWNNDKTIRFMATNNSEVKEISAYLEKEIAQRSHMDDNSLLQVLPYYIVFALDRVLSNRAEMMKQILSKKKSLGISVIAFYDVVNNLPKECTTVIELAGIKSKVFDKNDISGKFISFVPDIYMREQPREISVALSNIKLDTLASVYQLPTMITFLNMFHVGRVEYLNAATRWKENDPTKTLETEVGYDTLGETFKLDLHEKFHGPHGLVAGMTGSGKSEFIITYILSLAVNYHPYEVAFILIDYKGGGMAKSFENLPHTAGVITNLDGAAVKRSLISIQSELKRRQAIFNEAGKQISSSNIDIYKYQKLYREGRVTEPLQHLFIISDEFAELKTQQPEFMEQLVSAARIGRSLGVHLILATQKPSGVVDDQIWSNSKFRVCLKVQEKADSMDMLKRPDAAELSQTGRFYLQVGYNELFELGQSAWAGAPYYPADKVSVEKDDSIVVVDQIGRVVKAAKLDKKKNLDPHPSKQLDAITNYLKQIAEEENIHIKPLWLPQIPAVIYVDEIRAKYKVKKPDLCYLNPLIGEYDDPARQRQAPLFLPLTDDGNAVVYGVAGGGKTTFITTLIYSLMEEHTPDEVNLYILDFASETLQSFVKEPHVGDVLLAHETEKVTNLLKMLIQEMEVRKKKFSLLGGDYQAYIKSGEQIIPNIVVIINNYSAFAEIYEMKEEAVSYLTREGTKYGIYFVLTATNTNAVRYRLLQNFKQLFVMQLNDQSEYSGVLGSTDGLYPSKIKGRGILKTDNVYEYQTAHATAENINSFMLSYSKKKSQEWKGARARQVPILPDSVDVQFMSQHMTMDDLVVLPVGVDTGSLEIVYFSFERSQVTFVLSRDQDDSFFMQGLAALAQQKFGKNVIVFDIDMGFTQADAGYTYVGYANICEQVVVEIFNELVNRHNTCKDVRENGEDIPVFDKKVIIINSLVALKDALTEDGNQKLALILERAEKEYGMTIIIAESAGSISGISFEPWYKKQVDTGSGIWLSDGITDQYSLKLIKISNELYGEIGSDFGYAVIKGKQKLIKLLSAKDGLADE